MTDAARKAGLLVPLFSCPSSTSWGIGDIGDLVPLTAWLYREIVEKRKLLRDTDFMGGMTLAQVLPGINMTNMSVYVGQRLRGVKGALTAVLGLILVPFFAIILIGTFYAQIKEIPALHHFLDGVAASAVGLLMATVRTPSRDRVIDGSTMPWL